MTQDTTPTSGAADLPEALRRSTAADGKTELFNLPGYPLMVRAVDFNRIHTESEMRRAALLDEMQKAALAAGQATAAQPVVPAEWPTNEMIDAGRKAAASQGRLLGSGQSLWHVFRAMLAAAPAQPAAQQGVAYAALPDEGEPWRGHKFKEVQRGCWRCDCGKTIKEVTSDQSTPASGGNYPVMPKRYTVDDDGEELFTAEKMRDFADATHTLRASHGQAPAQPDPAYSAACHLATALFKKYFAHLPDFASGQAVWGLCGSTAGVISQIDNMVSGLVQPPATAFSEDELE